MANTKKSFVIGEHFESFIDKQVESGRFNNASEVVRAGLRLLERDETKLAELKRLIQEGEDDIAAGRVYTYSSAEELLDDIKGRSGRSDNEKTPARSFRAGES
ncbi:MAG: type II toxin-antitoxin system ParD family antitoxin [Shinella sp.]|nr:type II toxin-antitoxin system ParD family antitoxin [Shinella sp.]